MSVFMCSFIKYCVPKFSFYAESGSENPQLERVILKLRHGLELDFSFRVRVKELVVMVRFNGMSWEPNNS